MVTLYWLCDGWIGQIREFRKKATTLVGSDSSHEVLYLTLLYVLLYTKS